MGVTVPKFEKQMPYIIIIQLEDFREVEAWRGLDIFDVDETWLDMSKTSRGLEPCHLTLDITTWRKEKGAK